MPFPRPVLLVMILGAAFTAGIERPYYIALGMSSLSLLISLGLLLWIYWGLRRARQQTPSVTAIESVARELDRRSTV